MLAVNIHQTRTYSLQHSQRHLHAIDIGTAFARSTYLTFEEQILLRLQAVLRQQRFNLLLIAHIKNSLHPQSVSAAAHVIGR